MWTQAVETNFKVYVRNPNETQRSLLRRETVVECDLPSLLVGRITQASRPGLLRDGLTAPIPPNVRLTSIHVFFLF